MPTYTITTSSDYATALVKWLACISRMKLVFCVGDGIFVWTSTGSDKQFVRSVRRLRGTSVLTPSNVYVTCKKCSTLPESTFPSPFVRQVCLKCGNRMTLSYSS